MAQQLNEIHRVSYNTKFWQIIIGPWLLTFISAAWDRFESLRKAMEIYKIDKVITQNYGHIFVPYRLWSSH